MSTYLFRIKIAATTYGFSIPCTSHEDAQALADRCGFAYDGVLEQPDSAGEGEADVWPQLKTGGAK